ncbi:MAG: phage shock protein B [Alphaproteobacteria bacterium]|nr:MAG: phage shock protein B [Alphaproteobacteria bacterium]
MEDILGILFVPLILFVVFVAPIWIVLHYITRWRQTRMLSSEDEKLLAELWGSVDKMESRINNLERILDAEVADWRKQI